ncbi:MAG: cell wall-binding repeat-containing protein, partial [Coriobacteriia bacterium]|nr:cell wall-binding repeat-containing protein [Coriobacteriia bacterium]
MRAPHRSTLLASIAVVAYFAFAAVALADPPSVPMTVAGPNFETAASTLAGIAPINMIDGPAAAWWGRSTAVHRAGGSFGLWCAGTGGLFPNYPQKTRGVGNVITPGDFYTLDLDFWYLMPSLGAADASSFSIWWETQAAPTTHEVRTSLPRSASSTDWRHVTYDLDQPSSPVDLSRTSGSVWFQFFDFIEGAIQNPKVGQGVALDDLSFIGYRYGSVRNLAAESAPGGVRLTWNRPYRAVNSSAIEDRAITYRVWRKPQASPSAPWTELTLLGRLVNSADSVAYVDDQTPSDGVYYQYVVVPFDSGTGNGYGISSETIGRYDSPAATGVLLSVSVSPGLVSSSQPATFTYTMENRGSLTVTDLQLTDWFGPVLDAPPSLAAGATTAVLRAFPGSSDDYILNSVGLSGTSGGLPVTASAQLRLEIQNPAISLGTPSPSVAYASSGKQAVFHLPVTNAGDVPVDVSGSVDGGGWTETVGVQSLQVGQSTTLVVAAQVIGSGPVQAKVQGTCGAGQQWEATVSTSTNVDARVVPPRFSGSTRTQTAVELSKAAFPSGASSVVIATAYGYADALSASALAASVNGPLLLVRSDNVPAEVLAEIDRLNATKAYVIGGTAAVNTAAENQLTSAGLAVQRVAGTTRYDTASKVSGEVKNGVGESTTVFLATGTNFPDALAASSLAAAMKAPIMLTRPTDLPAETLAALRAYAPTRVVFVGGTSAVSDGV